MLQFLWHEGARDDAISVARCLHFMGFVRLDLYPVRAYTRTRYTF
jgi:hypothetical protein